MIMYKNAKGFTHTPIYIKDKKSKLVRGFTFVELIVATVILTIVVIGVYAAFLSAVKFSGTFRHKVMAVIGGQGVLEQACAENTWDNVNTLDGQSIATGGWRLNEEVEANSLSAAYSVSDANLSANGTDNPEYRFRCITVTVNWDEREI